MAADDDADLAGRLADIGDRPGGGASDLPVVEADIAGSALRRELGDQTNHRDATIVGMLDRLGDVGVVGGDHADRMDRRGELGDPLGDGIGREILEKLDPSAAADQGRALGRRGQDLGERLIERAVFLQEKEAERALGLVNAQALADGAGGVEADLFGGLQDPLGRAVPHRRSAVNHPVDRGQADPRGLGQISDGRSGHAVAP